jgi:signal transduction protein with GAF and PtsI domain
MGTAVVVYSPTELEAVPDHPVTDVEAELEHFHQAVYSVIDDMTSLNRSMQNVLPAEERALFDAFAMMLEGAGFEVEDLGTDVPPTKFLEAAMGGAQAIGMSALLTTTMGSMTDVIEAIEDSNLRDKVKIIIGGAPVTDAFAEEIGADGYASDASSAVRKVRELLGQ